MQLQPDDFWYQVKSKWLGSPPITLPFFARYVAWGLMVATFVGVLVVNWFLGLIPSHPFIAVWTFPVPLLLAALILRFSDEERGVKNVIALGIRLLRTLYYRYHGAPRETTYSMKLRIRTETEKV